MKAVDSFKKTKVFQHNLRPSQSLHTRFLKNHLREANINHDQRNLQSLTVCIIYKRKKIQFPVKAKTSFVELNKQLYSQLHHHLQNECQLSHQKVRKIMHSVVGFQSVDGDINFDYRLSLHKGVLQNTKFFYPFMSKGGHNEAVKYKMYNCLAIGGFSKVYLARSYENGQFYAIKFIRKSKSNDLQQKDKYQSLKNQIRVSQELEHPFLVKLLQAFETAHFYCMVFEYCPGGQLFYLLKKVKIMSQQMAKFYFLQILYGIQYLHSKSIIYRDLKPQNILIDADGNCKIVDFGLSKKIDARNKTFSYCGSAEYMAPQMILRTGHSFGIDYYSLGALLYELVTGLPPYYTKNHDQLQESIICKQITFPQHIPLSSQIKDLLERLLKKQQKYRLGSYIGIKEILFHPWVGKIKSTSILNKQIASPLTPNLRDYNFDTSELGEDEEEFTALVHQDINREGQKKNAFFKQFYKSNILSNHHNQTVQTLLQESKDKQSTHQSFKQNRQNSCPKSLVKLKASASKQKLKEIMKVHNINAIDRVQAKDRSFRMNITLQERRNKQISKLYPYLNCKQASPKKHKEIQQFIQHKIIKIIERPQIGRKLKRMRIQRNKLQTEEAV